MTRPDEPPEWPTRRILTQYALGLVAAIIGIIAVLTLVPPTAWPAPISALVMCVGVLVFVLKR